MQTPVHLRLSLRAPSGASPLATDLELFRAMMSAGPQIEGVKAKRRDSTYRPGVRSLDWAKIKRWGSQEGRAWKG